MLFGANEAQGVPCSHVCGLRRAGPVSTVLAMIDTLRLQGRLFLQVFGGVVLSLLRQKERRGLTIAFSAHHDFMSGATVAPRALVQGSSSC